MVGNTGRNIEIALRLAYGQFSAGLTAAGAQARKFGADIGSVTRDASQQWEQLTRATMVMGAGMLAGFGLAVKASADFEAELSNLQAATSATAGEMAALEQQALAQGAATAFSAREAAQAQTELAKAGLTTTEILGGGLPAALNLAGAGQLELGRSAEIAAMGASVFNIAGSEMERVADTLAAGANKSAADVEGMAQSLEQSGLVASQLGLSLEDTVGTLAAFADSGLRGSDAGTSLKTMLQRLVPQSREAAAEMERLGLDFFDARGEFIGIEAAAGELQQALGHLSEEQRFAAMTTLFGADAIRGANILYTEGAEGIGEWVDQVSDSGYAAELAGVKMDNLKGDIEELSGALETLLITSGEDANDVLREMTQQATNFVNGIGALPDPLLNVTAAFTGIAGAGLLIAGGLGAAVPKLKNFNAELRASGPAGARVAGGLHTIAGGAARGAVAVGALASAFIVAKGAYQQWSNAGTAMANDALDPLLERMRNGSLSVDEFNAAVGETANQYNRLQDELAGSQAPWDEDKREQMAAGSKVLEDFVHNSMRLGDQVAHIAEATGEADYAVANWLMRQMGAGQVFSSNEAALAAYNESVLVAAGVNPELAGQMAATDQAFVNQTKAAEEATQALEDWSNKVRAQWDPVFALVDAQNANADATQAVADAQNELNAAYASGDPAAVAEAQRALDQAHRDSVGSALDLTIAEQSLLAELEKNPGLLQANIDALGGWDAQNRLAQGTADVWTTKLAAMALGVQSIPTLWTTTINGDASGLVSAVDAAIGRLNVLFNMADAVGLAAQAGISVAMAEQVIRQGGIAPLAAGGPVTAGDMYLVGERGPELFVSDRSGTIVPNHQLPAAAGWPPVTSRMGVTPSIPAPVVNVAAGGIDYDRLADAIVGAARRTDTRRGPLGLLDRDTGPTVLKIGDRDFAIATIGALDKERERT